MARKQPDAEPPEVKRWSSQPAEREIGGTPIIVQERQYRLITPLFGGGVEASVNDLVTLIRGTEIRGQLRFWWRATRGGQPKFEGKPDKMKAREDEIWGAASNTRKQQKQGKGEEGEGSEEQKWQRAVQIVVNIDKEQKNTETKQDVEPFFVYKDVKGKIRSKPTHRVPAYVAFPLQPTREELAKAKVPDEVQIKKVRKDVTFTLIISFVEEWADDVLAALWAWETFGGIGARTRRGFGALQLIDDDQSHFPFADIQKAEDWIQENLRKYCVSGTFPDNMPHLSVTMPVRVIGPEKSPMDAWKSVVEKLSEFRQAPHGRAGRSNWPEAETIRNTTGYRKDRMVKGRRRWLRPLNHPSKFPRAAFGLPIIFHFKDENTRAPLDTSYDPPEMSLQGKDEGQQRWASPLILRPLACRDGKALGMACVLQGSQPPQQLLLKPKDARIKSHTISLEQTLLKPQEANKLPVQGNINVLQAFLDFCREKEEK